MNIFHYIYDRHFYQEAEHEQFQDRPGFMNYKREEDIYPD